MALITFFEKPGCMNNTRQKKLLKSAGHQLIERNLLSEPWTPGRLRPFFRDEPVANWFNRAAPRVKNGEVVPEQINAELALTMMVEDPLLIRRPLMVCGSLYLCGFDADEVNQLLDSDVVEQQQSETLQRCAKEDGHKCKVEETCE